MYSKVLEAEGKMNDEKGQDVFSSTCGIIVVDRNSTIIQIDRVARELLNNPRGLEVGSKLDTVLGASVDADTWFDADASDAHFEVSFKGRELLIEVVRARIDISWCNVLVIRDKNTVEHVLRNIKNKRDLSALLDNVVEHSYDGIYITDGEAKTLLINKAYERITGLNRDTMMDKNMKELVSEGAISRSGSLEVLKKKRTVTMKQSFRTGKEALITSKPVFNEKGEVGLVITNVRDITELVSLKKKLDEQETLAQKYYEEVVELKKQITDTSDLIVEDKKMIDVLYSAQKVAVTDITVHISGESGVGKEVLAKFIHTNSRRKDKNFINVNCGAIPENLIETELFGYVKGAFSGADPNGKKGLFETANEGTIFLDEIGELPMNMQVKLLRVLQEQEFTRVGDVTPIKVDVRVISATNKDLKSMVDQKLFREDLYYRLNVIPLKIPSLRERHHDILAMVGCFLERTNRRYNFNKGFSREAMLALESYHWPGNIRELKNVVERAVVLSDSDLIGCLDLPQNVCGQRYQGVYADNDSIIPLKEAVGNVEKRLIEMAYEEYGNVRDAAKVLGIDPSTFVRKRKKYI